MGFFGFRKDKVVDLTERYKRQQEKQASQISDTTPSQTQDNGSEDMGFFAAMSSSAQNNEPSSTEDSYVDFSSREDDGKKKLAKRILDMTGKIEELSNQVYHLQQRIELLERKSGVGSGY